MFLGNITYGYEIIELLLGVSRFGFNRADDTRILFIKAIFFPLDPVS